MIAARRVATSKGIPGPGVTVCARQGDAATMNAAASVVLNMPEL